ncbi:MAG: hypothetical protein NW200_11760 [Hyphomonadaceae bacterium]|nr:hypothetical protein [Hyphomonadaceae bacterium]
MKVWTAALLAVAVGFSVTAAHAQPKGKARAQPAPPPPPAAAAPVLPAGPPPEPLAAAIPAYAAFQSDITDLQNQSVANADELEAVLNRAAAQNRAALMRGWLAYGALTAAQSPRFVAEVRKVSGHYGTTRFVRGLTLDPGYAQTLDGGADAARLALASARADGERVFTVGERYKQMAYGLQKQRWAGQVAPQQPARVQRLRTLAEGAGARTVAPELTARLTAAAGSVSPWSDPNQFGGLSFWDAFRTTPAPSVAQIAAPTYTLRPNQDRVGAVNRMTTLAALYIVGATQDPASQTERLLSEDSTKNCLELAQVQFYQCMSAARFRYENAFCLGEHALKDMGACIRDASTVDTGAMSTPVAALPPAPAAAQAPATQRK